MTLWFVIQRMLNAGGIPVSYILFMLLAIVVAWFPISTDETVFSLVSGVSLAVFVIYGIVPELALSTLALIAVIIKVNIKTDQHHRYALNLLLVAILSVTSAGAYYLTETILGSFNAEWNGIIPLLVYMMVHSIMNQALSYMTNKYYYGQENIRFWNQQLLFSFQTNVYILPLTYQLIYLYYRMGAIGVFIGILPFLSVTIGLNYYFKMRHNNVFLTQVNKAAQRLTSEMSRKSVLQSFILSLIDIVPVDNVLYFNILEGTQVVLEKNYNKDGSIEELNTEMVLPSTTAVKNALGTHTISVYSKAKEWLPMFTYNKDFSAESAIVIPVHILTKNKGFILMTHRKRAVYDGYTTSLVEMFYQYFITVLDNVHHYEKLEKSSMTDYLTNLPNLRGFTDRYKKIYKANNSESLSIIILDLDYFKQVNDVHGHEAGNDVLRQVADVLKKFKGSDRYFARYGGEEFIILLQDYGKEGANKFAEKIRKAIAETVFHIHYSIATDSTAEISLTASLGLATYPEDSDDVYELIHLADRVMYLGSKQSGRNKVTAYNKES